MPRGFSFTQCTFVTIYHKFRSVYFSFQAFGSVIFAAGGFTVRCNAHARVQLHVFAF